MISGKVREDFVERVKDIAYVARIIILLLVLFVPLFVFVMLLTLLDYVMWGDLG